MENTMRYITIEENELFEKIAEVHGIKDYTIPGSLSCHESNMEFEKQFYTWMEKKDKEK